MKESVVFYKSFYDAIKTIPQEYQLELYNAIFMYAFEGVEPTELSPVANVVFTLAKPNIDSAQKRYAASVENGKKGGRPKKNNQTETQEKPNNNLNKTQHKPNSKPTDNLNANVNANVDENDYDDDYLDKSMKLFFETYPQVEVNCNLALSGYDLDFSLLLGEFERSDYLRRKCNSLRFIATHYQEIVSGKYRNDTDKEVKPVVDGSKYNIV